MGGFLGPVSDPDKRKKSLSAELANGRLAMVAFLGLCVQALAVGEGALGSLNKFAATFN